MCICASSVSSVIIIDCSSQRRGPRHRTPFHEENPSDDLRLRTRTAREQKAPQARKTSIATFSLVFPVSKRELLRTRRSQYHILSLSLSLSHLFYLFSRISLYIFLYILITFGGFARRFSSLQMQVQKHCLNLPRITFIESLLYTIEELIIIDSFSQILRYIISKHVYACTWSRNSMAEMIHAGLMYAVA